MKPVKVLMFQADDGTNYSTIREAAHADAESALRKLVARRSADLDDTQRDLIAEFLIDDVTLGSIARIHDELMLAVKKAEKPKAPKKKVAPPQQTEGSVDPYLQNAASPRSVGGIERNGQ